MSEDKKKIGYGNPPKHTQFGSEGKPGGRPKGAKNRPKPLTNEAFRDIVLEEGGRLITITESGEKFQITTVRGIVRALNHSAIQDRNVRAAEKALDLYAKAEGMKSEEKVAHAKSVNEYRRSWYAKLADQQKRGIDGPKPAVHPDYIIIDPHTLEVHVLREATPEEAANIRWFWDRWTAFTKENEMVRAELNKAEDESDRKYFLDWMARNESMLDILRPYVYEIAEWPQPCW